MNLFFDEMSQKLIADAKAEMYELKHPYVGSEHLFLAILKNTTLDITKILNSYNITYKQFKDKLIDIVGKGTKTNDWFLFTPLLRKILSNASFYSEEDEKLITPYSLLVSILEDGDGVANRILISMNIDLEVIYEKIVYSKKKSDKYNCAFLNEVGINMNEIALSDKYDPVIGRNDCIKNIIQVLLRKNKNNPLLVGDAGVGKTAIVEELARLIALGKVPLKLKNKVIYSISMSSLVAGTKYRGEFEEKVNNLIQEVKNNSNIILFIDEIHTLMGAGGAEGAIDAANILKPYLARGELKIIGATTTMEYDKFLAKDRALDRRFQKIYIDEPDEIQVRHILLKLKPIYEKFHNVCISNEIIELILNLSFNSIFIGSQPDKAIDLMDEVCSFASTNDKDENFVNNYEFKINLLEKEKNMKIIEHNFKEALVLREEENKIRNEYNNYLFSSLSLEPIKVKKKDVSFVVSRKNNVPDKEKMRKQIFEFKKKIKKVLYGQDNVLNLVSRILLKYDYIDIKEPTTLLFVGKNGVGKTFLADKIVSEFFSNNSIKINMNEYTDSQSISKLIGTNPGYVGYNDHYLLEKLKYNSYSLVILDNIDNANSKIMDFFYKSISDGYFYNSRNEKISIVKTIFIMISSNIDKCIGFVDNKNMFNNSFPFTYIIEFNDIDINSVNKYIDFNYANYNFDKSKFVEEIDFINNGFKNVDYVLKKYLYTK